MDRFKKISFALTFWFLLLPALGSNSVFADEAVNLKATPEKAEKQPSGEYSVSTESAAPNKTQTPNPATRSGAANTNTLAAQFPQLQRALIILTIINFVIIIFASLMYLVKRRMQQFSPAPLAKLNQES